MKTNRNEIRRLMIAVNRIDELYYRTLRSLGIKDNTFVLFYAISDGKPYSQKQICDEWMVPRTTLNTIVRECIKAGYVELISCGHKEKEIVLTGSGKIFADKILSPIFEAEEKAIHPLAGTALVEQLENFTENLETAFQKIIEDKR